MSGMELSSDEVLGTVQTPPAQAAHAMAYLVQHDATDLAEMLGLTPGYWGRHVDVKRKVDRPVWREGLL